MVAEVILNLTSKQLNKTFDYVIPKVFEKKAHIGDMVTVPFGPKDKLEYGFIVNIKEKSKFAKKDIQKIAPGITSKNIELAQLMSNKYFCNVIDAIKLMLPPKSLSDNNRPKDKTGIFVYLKKEYEEIELDILNGILKSKKQIAILEFLKDNDGIYALDLEVILETTRQTLKKMEENGYIELIEEKIERNPFEGKNVKKDAPLKLTKEQQHAYDKIANTMDENKYKEFLLYGVTGSGKTEVYLQLIQKAIEKGKKAVVLVPEISLTPQMVNRFIARFGQDTISIIHSKLSLGERFDQWNKIKSGKSNIVIGARSAIFAPISDIGIIIIDEEHDSSYKSEMSPKYSAKDVAKYLGKENNAPVVYGSATPDINTFYKAQTGQIELLKLSSRANKSSLPVVEIVDLREELAKGNKSMISQKLYEEIKQNIENKKQTILFLNRRGFSTFVMCRECGHTIKCKNCNITLTYHLRENRLKCHYCGYEIKAVTICPECNSKKIKYFGMGTQKLEDEINKMFPKATTIRMDIDTVSKKNSHEKILDKFKNENIDILIGTQMVVKGHHFPNVTLVGVIAADASLNIDDYRANERTFQILTQVAGRAGREKDNGKVIVQTYNTDNYSIEYAKLQNYDLFYNAEIGMRQQLKYPPFCDIILFNITSTDADEIKTVSEKLYNDLTNNLQEIKDNVKIYKPVPSPIDKIKNKYRWRIILKCKFNLSIINYINKTLEQQKNYKYTKIMVDVNPNSMM